MQAARLLSLLVLCTPALAAARFGPVETVLADGVPLAVNGYAIPDLADWNGDGRPDLLVGEGGGAAPQSKIRLYLNQGGPGAPLFSNWTYLQAAGADIVQPSSGCMGCCPRVADWNGDSLPDLLVGRSDGTVLLFLNQGQPGAPLLAAGVAVTVGPQGGQVPLNVGSRATPEWLDWDGDGRPDLLCGALDGKARVALNQGGPGAPLLAAPLLLSAASGADLAVTSGRSCFVVLDDNGDGLPDLVSGNTNGELLYSRNNGTMADEAYGPWEPVVCGGAAFDLPGTQRSRPVFRDWNGDGVPDLLVGYGDGLVRLCLAPPAPPEPLLATVVSGVLRLTWPAGLPGDVVRVQRKELPGGEWILLGETAGSHWDEALPADGGALFRVTRVR
ncbi:MAG: VCBS repeat-containing protein [bacterium]|nr:VCBS repeat-containing protein [bacterium]